MKRAVVAVLLLVHVAGAQQKRDTIPASLPDREFWALSQQLSEPDGYFRSNSGSPDNLLSNETTVSTAAAALAELAKPGGIYLGVGPEQNFSYIAAMRPRMAFVIDIRRGNLHLHLLYKALFEMSAGREPFVMRLFSRKPPSDPVEAPSASVLMNRALFSAPLDEAGFEANLKAVVAHLTTTRRLPLDKEDLAGIEYVYRAFHQFGPNIHYTSSIGGRSGNSYARIVTSVDAMTGQERTYLASDEAFQTVKALHQKNLVIPIVGDFAGPKALRAVGDYVRSRGAVISAFYVSNVEDYLRRNGVWPTFCANVSTMPLDAGSVFIRPNSGRNGVFTSMAAECPR